MRANIAGVDAIGLWALLSRAASGVLPLELTALAFSVAAAAVGCWARAADIAGAFGLCCSAQQYQNWPNYGA